MYFAIKFYEIEIKFRFSFESLMMFNLSNKWILISPRKKFSCTLRPPPLWHTHTHTWNLSTGKFPYTFLKKWFLTKTLHYIMRKCLNKNLKIFNWMKFLCKVSIAWNGDFRKINILTIYWRFPNMNFKGLKIFVRLLITFASWATVHWVLESCNPHLAEGVNNVNVPNR